jgi:hypothetical protein
MAPAAGALGSRERIRTITGEFESYLGEFGTGDTSTGSVDYTAGVFPSPILGDDTALWVQEARPNRSESEACIVHCLVCQNQSPLYGTLYVCSSNSMKIWCPPAMYSCNTPTSSDLNLQRRGGLTRRCGRRNVWWDSSRTYDGVWVSASLHVQADGEGCRRTCR